MFTDIMFTHDETRGVTVCNIRLEETGVARRNFDDEHDAYEGRKRSFARAVRSFPREVRTFLWQEFHRQVTARQSACRLKG